MELHRTTTVPRRRPPDFKYLGFVLLHPSRGIEATLMSLESDNEVRAGRDRRILGIQPVKIAHRVSRHGRKYFESEM